MLQHRGFGYVNLFCMSFALAAWACCGPTCPEPGNTDNVIGPDGGDDCTQDNSAPATTVAIETVPVGDPDNEPDMRGDYDGNPTPGYGAVAYSYEIGRFEVTAGQYAAFLNAVAQTDTYGLYEEHMADPDNSKGCNIQRCGSWGSYTYRVAADWANRPVNYVSLVNAARFANWLHNGQPTGLQDPSTTEDGSYCINGASADDETIAITRKSAATWVVPSEDEWYKAAYYDPAKPGGEGYWMYATRSESRPANRLEPEGTNNANSFECYPDVEACPMYPASVPAPPPYYRTEVGAFAGSPSAYGTFDQTGNVAERNEGTSSCPRGRGDAGVRGGAWLVYDPWDDECWELTSGGWRCGSAQADPKIGFRVGKVAPVDPLNSGTLQFKLASDMP